MELKIYNPNEQPFGLLSNNARYNFSVRGIKYYSVTEYVYCSIFTDVNLRRKMKLRLNKNPYDYCVELLTDLTRQFFTQYVELALVAKYKQHPNRKTELIKTRGLDFIFTENNDHYINRVMISTLNKIRADPNIFYDSIYGPVEMNRVNAACIYIEDNLKRDPYYPNTAFAEIDSSSVIFLNKNLRVDLIQIVKSLDNMVDELRTFLWPRLQIEQIFAFKKHLLDTCLDYILDTYYPSIKNNVISEVMLNVVPEDKYADYILNINIMLMKINSDFHQLMYDTLIITIPTDKLYAILNSKSVWDLLTLVQITKIISILLVSLPEESLKNYRIDKPEKKSDELLLKLQRANYARLNHEVKSNWKDESYYRYNVDVILSVLNGLTTNVIDRSPITDNPIVIESFDISLVDQRKDLNYILLQYLEDNEKKILLEILMSSLTREQRNDVRELITPYSQYVEDLKSYKIQLKYKLAKDQQINKQKNINIYLENLYDLYEQNVLPTEILNRLKFEPLPSPLPNEDLFTRISESNKKYILTKESIFLVWHPDPITIDNVTYQYPMLYAYNVFYKTFFNNDIQLKELKDLNVGHLTKWLKDRIVSNYVFITNIKFLNYSLARLLNATKPYGIIWDDPSDAILGGENNIAGRYLLDLRDNKNIIREPSIDNILIENLIQSRLLDYKNTLTLLFNPTAEMLGIVYGFYNLKTNIIITSPILLIFKRLEFTEEQIKICHPLLNAELEYWTNFSTVESLIERIVLSFHPFIGLKNDDYDRAINHLRVIYNLVTVRFKIIKREPNVVLVETAPGVFKRIPRSRPVKMLTGKHTGLSPQSNLIRGVNYVDAPERVKYYTGGGNLINEKVSVEEFIRIILTESQDLSIAFIKPWRVKYWSDYYYDEFKALYLDYITSKPNLNFECAPPQEQPVEIEDVRPADIYDLNIRSEREVLEWERDRLELLSNRMLPIREESSVIERTPIQPVVVERAPGLLSIEQAPVQPVVVEQAPIQPVVVERAPGLLSIEQAPIQPVVVERAPGLLSIEQAPIQPVVVEPLSIEQISRNVRSRQPKSMPVRRMTREEFEARRSRLINE